MKVVFDKNEEQMIAYISGSLDTVTAPEFQNELTANWDGVKELILDLTDVEYVSSAGLRVIMIADEHMDSVGSLTLRGLNFEVAEVFEMTGLNDILNIQ